MRLPGDANANPTSHCPRCSATALPVAVDFRLPLTREAVAALVRQDQRFALVDPGKDADRGHVVALVDSLQDRDNRLPLLSWSAVRGYVRLTGQPTCSSVRRDACGNLACAELPYSSPWREVAEALLKVAAEAWSYTDRQPPGARTDWQRQRSVLTLLTARERDVLRLIAAGLSVREMARMMHLADSTVDNHRSRLMKKLGVHKAVDAARFAYRIGLAAP
ncbi:Transcriptional regulatory protein TdiR [Posidoniimonas corsicana]|uniref:Transcriptional regulatory protein TdiR n=1 Tax=Posidoniimonas corsicana TaxID=1938618 RepID=A0A5C5VEY2_9BACT|nr:LuxR C-terminal-related transcriptional regulator [Posidoniimonas corsicana]TWT37194.1 Transcriptional regulatory protein TdiR [Posidoniimonas corsicana]